MQADTATTSPPVKTQSSPAVSSNYCTGSFRFPFIDNNIYER